MPHPRGRPARGMLIPAPCRPQFGCCDRYTRSTSSPGIATRRPSRHSCGARGLLSRRCTAPHPYFGPSLARIPIALYLHAPCAVFYFGAQAYRMLIGAHLRSDAVSKLGLQALCQERRPLKGRSDCRGAPTWRRRDFRGRRHPGGHGPAAAAVHRTRAGALYTGSFVTCDAVAVAVTHRIHAEPVDADRARAAPRGRRP